MNKIPSLKGSKAYQRRISPESRASIEMYAELTAEMLWGWNRLHSALFDLFQSFFTDNPSRYDVTSAIWHMFQSDKNQREMLRDVATASLQPRSLKLKQIKWLLKSIDKIAPYRNAVVHVPVYFQSIKAGQPNAIMLDVGGARDQARLRLELAGSGQTFWDKLAGDLFVLGQFTRSLILRGTVGDEGAVFPSLHRPRLLSLRRIAEIDRQMSLLQEKKAPVRRRRAYRRKRKP